MKKIAILPGLLTAVLCCGSLGVSAYTPDDVAQKAREAGWPETLIQIGYNEWSSGEFSQQDLDDAYDSVLEYNTESEKFICNSLGVSVDKVRALAAGDSQNATDPENPDAPQETQPPTPVTPYERIDSAEFINMPLEEKQEYISSLEEDQQADFIASLSREERNSIIKQLPTEDKMELMQNYINTAQSMGMNVAVDNISEQDISVTIRNEEGVVIDKAAVGIVIDETGISRTKPLLFSGIGILISLAGFGLVYRYGSKSDE